MPPLVLDGTNGVSGVDGTASNPAIEGTDSNTGIFYPAADTVAIGTNGTEALRVNSAQNMGLGATPSTWTIFKALEVGAAGTGLAGAAGQPVLFSNCYYNGGWKYAANGFAANYDQSSGQHRWFNVASGTANANITFTQAMTLTASGQLELTAAAPRLAIAPSTGTNNAFVHFINSASASFSYVGIDSNGGGLGGQYTMNLWHGANYAMVFATNNTERARITSGGGFYVGTTTANFSGKFEVVDSGATAVGFTNTSGTATNQVLGLWQQAGSGNNLWVQFYSDAGGTSRGSIDYNRGSALTRYNTTSDATLKNIIGDSDGQKSVEILNSTRIREYAWKDDEQQKPQIGVIAQELYETYKGAVSAGGDYEDTDAEGNVVTKYRPWSVDKTAFTFHLIAGWQAHEKMIQELKAEIAALKGNA